MRALIFDLDGTPGLRSPVRRGGPAWVRPPARRRSQPEALVQRAEVLAPRSG